MKVNIIKLIIVLGISSLIGLLFFEFAKQDDSKNWIVLATSVLSILLCLGAAIAVDYNSGYRSANIKMTAWIFAVLVILFNFIFALLPINITVYIALISILVLINIGIIYALYKSQSR